MTVLKTYEVTGELDPDATGTYEDAGEYGGKRYYQRVPDGFFLWAFGVNQWVLNDNLGKVLDFAWNREDPNIEGDYQPLGNCTGVATVTEV